MPRTYAAIMMSLLVLCTGALPVWAQQTLSLSGQVTLGADTPTPAVRLALEDLARDLGWVLGQPGQIAATRSQITVRIDPALQQPESYRIEITAKGITIAGADELGTIYGIYRFSHQCLGVDPYWFWTDRRPARKERLELPAQVIESTPAVFRYRGWFVNDEDLLSEWKSGGGKRDIDYPFYSQVVHIDILDRVFETILRSGGNLVIPASFVDVMNEPEANLVRRAAQRGLCITQHHVEPVGVSHFGFENYWKRQGKPAKFSYASDPDKIRQTWTAYIKKWREMAGDRVIWQLGLRGRGDVPAWASDKAMTEAQAGQFISSAIADQYAIVRSIDPRPQPPATATLWLEGSKLMSQGSLKFPPGITIVFADEGGSQTMQSDFINSNRSPDFRYGVYYHIGFWARGPHMLQGTRPDKIKRVFDQIVAKGDTHYAIVNVCNVREHVLGIDAAMQAMKLGQAFDPAKFMDGFAPPALRPVYQQLFDAWLDLGKDRILQDGCAWVIAKDLLDLLAKGKTAGALPYTPPGANDYAAFAQALEKSIAKLDAAIAAYPSDQVPAAERAFFDVHLLLQAKMTRALYEYDRQLMLALADRSHLAQAENALAEVLEIRKQAEQGHWANWYRGDKKMNLPALLARTRALMKPAK